MTDPRTAVVVITHHRRAEPPHTPDEPTGLPGGPPSEGTSGAVARLRPAVALPDPGRDRFRCPRRPARRVHGPGMGNERGRDVCRGARGAARR
ncbi:hypothetical protein ACFT5C_24150 [Streptomyces sp. NPDC057116]|uniref:hypothetical protein n=1 Tax=Streptomyces sp. NPDC057116 TaxID=3346023 RepID=UPI00362CBC55